MSTYESELRKISSELNLLSYTLSDSIRSNLGVTANFYINKEIPEDRVNKIIANKHDSKVVYDIVHIVEDSLCQLLVKLKRVGVEKYRYSDAVHRSSINVRDSADKIIESLRVSVYKYSEDEYDISVCYNSNVFESLLSTKGKSHKKRSLIDRVKVFYGLLSKNRK